MPGQAGGLVTDAFHQVAQRGHHPGAVVHQALAEPRRQQPLGQRHSHRRWRAPAPAARWWPRSPGAGRAADARRLRCRWLRWLASRVAASIACMPGQVQQRHTKATRHDPATARSGHGRAIAASAASKRWNSRPQYSGDVGHRRWPDLDARAPASAAVSIASVPQRVGHDVTGWRDRPQRRRSHRSAHGQECLTRPGFAEDTPADQPATP